MQKKSKSKVDELGVRTLMEDLFAAGTEYKDIVRIIHEKTGETIAESTCSRAYHKWQREKMGAEAIEREVEVLMRALAGNPDLDIKKTVLGVFWAKVAQRFSQANMTFDRADALDMSHLLLKAFRTEQAGGQLDVQQARLELMKQRAVKVADTVKDRLMKAGASPEEVAKMVDEILGVAA